MRASPLHGWGLRRSSDPYHQGDLDGLCGLYSVVNAVSALCPELDEDGARSLFRVLLRSLGSYVPKPMGVVCFGMDEACIRHLLTVAQHDAEKRLKAYLKIRPYRKSGGRLSVPKFWQTLDSQLGPSQVAVAGLSGARDHWTVVSHISGRAMVLLDSTDLRSLTRPQITLKVARTRYGFDPDELVFVKRLD
jgi:hypothetical protein